MNTKIACVFLLMQIAGLHGFDIELVCVVCINPPTCPYGFELTSSGCSTCRCKNPCTNYVCPVGETCVAEELPCGRFPCGLRPRCQCLLRCAYGYETDCSGCKICRCQNPCKNVVCPRGQYCSIRASTCTTTSCVVTYNPVCVNYCPIGTPILTANETFISCSL